MYLENDSHENALKFFIFVVGIYFYYIPAFFDMIFVSHLKKKWKRGLNVLSLCLFVQELFRPCLSLSNKLEVRRVLNKSKKQGESGQR